MPRHLLTHHEEALLGRRIRQGDPEALNTLVTRNLRLVAKIARDFEGRGLALEDLVGEGNLGLIRAARRFDPDFGVPFGTYASHWIKQAIRHALISTTSTIRLPCHMVRLLAKWRRAEMAYLSRHGHCPSRETLAAMLGLGESRRRMLEQALIALRPPIAAGDENGSKYAIKEVASGHEGPDAPLLADDDRRALWESLGQLDDRERLLLSSRFGLDGASPVTLEEAGRSLGISRGWASKIEKRAIHRLGCQLGK